MSVKNIPIHFWHGEDTFSIYESLTYWKKSFKEKYSALNILSYSEQDYSQEHSIKLLGHSVNSQSLFGETKLVILKNILSAKKLHPETERSIQNVLKNPGAGTFVIFIQTEKIANKELHTAITKLTTKSLAIIKEYPLPDAPKLAAWVAACAKKKNIAIDKSAITSLIAATIDLPDYRPTIDSTMLWSLAEELQKLHAYTGGRTITTADVKAMETTVHHDALWNLINGLLAGNKKLSANLLQKRLAATPAGAHAAEFRTLLTIFSSQLRTLLAAKKLSSTAFATYAKKSKLSQGRQYMITKQANAFSEERLTTLQQNIITLFITSIENPQMLKAQFVLLLI